MKLADAVLPLVLYGYAVRVRSKDGRSWLAHGAGVAPHIDYKRKKAVAYKRELQPHLPECKLKVVRVRVNIEEISEAGDE